LKLLCDAIRFMRHKVGAHKFRQITVVNYSPIIQIKLYYNISTPMITFKIFKSLKI